MPVWVQIDAYDPVAGAPVTLRAGNMDDASVCMAANGPWWPMIAKAPVLRYDLFDGAFGGEITAPTTAFSLQVEAWPNFGRYAIADARVRVWTDITALPIFDGRATVQPKLANGQAEISIKVDDSWLDTPLLGLYAGTTGLEGSSGLKGQPKPLALGAPRYVPGKLIDSVNNVFQVSAYGVIQGFEAALERLARFGAPVANYASYTDLVAASIPAGAWATCNAQGVARFGAPTTGQVSFLIWGDVAGPDGWARKPGQMIRRLALLSGGTGKIHDASLNALDAARPYNLSIYQDQQTTARQLIQSIAASVNAVAGVSWTGKLFVVPVGLGTATMTLAADGSALPPVRSVEQMEVAAPFAKIALTAERAWTVHALADIAFVDPLVDMGVYNNGSYYRPGNIVQFAGATWRYRTGAAPGSGNAPPTPPTASNTWWTVLAQQGTAGAAGAPGPASFTLVAQANVSIGPDYISRSIPWTNAWDASAYSSEAFVGGAFVSQITTALSGGTMLGLNTDPTTSAGYDTIDFAFYCENTAPTGGKLWVAENGTITQYGTWAIGDTLTIVYDNKSVRYLQNGDVLRQVAAAANLKLYLDSSIADTGKRISNIKFGPSGSAGADGISAILTNESVTLGADSAGNVSAGDLAAAGGTFRVFSGTTEVTGSGVTYSVIAGANLATTINATTGVYTPSALYADTGYAVLRATYGGVNIDKVFSASKSRAGTNGANAKTLIVLSDRQTIAYDASGAPSPTTQTITFTTNKQNTSATVYWSITDANGTAVSVAYLSAASGDSVYMTEANFAVARNGTSGVIVTGTLTDGTTISDKISVIAVRAGANGTPGTDALSVSLSPAAISVPCTASGTPKAALPGAQLTVFKGTTDVTGSSSYSTVVSNLSGVTVSGSGAVSVTGMSADTGSVEITATKDGASQKVKLVYTKARDGAAYVEGSSFVSPPSSTTYATVATVDLLMGPAGMIGFDTNGFFVTDTGSVNMQGTVDYSLNAGSSWTTAATFTGNPSNSGSDGDWGSANSISGSLIGLSTKQTVNWRVTMRKTTTQPLSDFGGTLAVNWSGS